MSKRKQRRESGASWAGDDGNQSTSLQDFTAQGYGLDLKPSVRIVARPFDIFTIRPNTTQPRRAVPSSVRLAVGDENPVELLEHWINQTDGVDIEGILDGDEDAQRPAQPDAQSANLLRVVDLAATIKRDGLTNPITVTKTTDHEHIIETGERRWLAYHLLNIHYPGENWSEIPARTMDNLSVWRQASENNARDDLNAIGKARQLALLLMDLYGWEQFQPIEAFDHEQDFYAQVADGEQWRVPRGAGTKILQVMGLSNTSQLRQYRAILRVPSDFWTHADDHDLTEFEIREAAKRDYTVTRVTVKKNPSRKKRFIDKIEHRYTPARWQKLEPRQQREIRDRLRVLLTQIEAMTPE